VKDGSAQAFPKDRRVRKRREFLHIQENGSRVTLPSAIVLLAARSDDGPARLGITVTRNGVDFVVIPKTSAATALSLTGLHDEWTRAAGLLGARADSLRRALANAAATPQTGKPRGSRR
jgi:RNase P protein component